MLSAYYFPLQGGSETHARAIAVYLSRHGFRVTIVTRRVDRQSPALETVDGLPVHRVWPDGPRTGPRKWLMIPFAIYRILTLRREFDLIYCPGYQGIGVAAIVSGKLLGRPVILRSGNLGVLRGDQWTLPLSRWGIGAHSWAVSWMKARLRNLYMKADAFVCNSREIEREALACHVPPDHVHYLPNAVDVARYRLPHEGEKARIRSDEGWPADALVVLYVGRLSLEKGVMDLLEAWRDVRLEHAVLVLVGPDMTGNLMDAGPAARHYVSDHGLQDRVIFYGESRDPARLLRAADMYVQPSHYEAFSNAVIEAMATGLPLVASSVGGMLDCIVDDDNGVFCRPADAADIALKLGRLLNDPQLRARLGTSARQSVVAHFDEATIFARFADLCVATSARVTQ